MVEGKYVVMKVSKTRLFGIVSKTTCICTTQIPEPIHYITNSSEIYNFLKNGVMCVIIPSLTLGKE